MSDLTPISPTNATYVDPSAETILKPGLKLGDLLRRNMTQPYVLQRLSQRTWWVQSFNSVIASEATSTLRPKYGDKYGFDEATPPNAKMVA